MIRRRQVTPRAIAGLAISVAAHLVMGCGGSIAQSSNPRVNIQVNRYPIVGSTAAALRQQMNQLGPGDFDGYTQWYVRWNYRFQTTAYGCRLTQPQVNTDVTITLPVWQPPPIASPQLVQRWQRYLTALEAHENNHKRHGLSAGNEILARLRTLPASRTCQQLETIANNSAHAIIRKYNQADLAYDRRTNHGVFEGAKFP